MTKAGQSNPRIAFQGDRGAYSEEAIVSFFERPFRLYPSKTLADTFRALELGSVDYSVVPIENSLEGSVNETYDLLLKSRAKVFAEINLRINHCLISHPSTEVHTISTVFSHPQALAQCRGYLQNLRVEVIPTYDTAGSVRMIRQRKLRDSAAVASNRAAQYFKMKVLAKGIQDAPNNFTRFFVLGKARSKETGRDKTSIIFSLKHMPGALYGALGEFASRDINLTKIESRPTRQLIWEYYFYLDFERHQFDKEAKEALKGLKGRASFLKILGSYPRAEPLP